MFTECNINYLNEITILGSGTSTGSPILGCECPTCTSSDPHDKRLRTSFVIETSSKKRFLFETSPDLRYQLLRTNIDWIDAVFVTHEHADHLHGIDDLRPLSFSKDIKYIPLYTHKKSAKSIKKRFKYIFDDQPLIGGGIPLLKLYSIRAPTKMNIRGEEFEFFLVPHGRTQSMGIIHKSFIYIPDCEYIPGNLLKRLGEIECSLLLITCLQEHTHDTHLNVQKCFHYIDKINPDRAALIHMNHNLKHQDLLNKCSHEFSHEVAPSFDGAKYCY